MKFEIIVITAPVETITDLTVTRYMEMVHVQCPPDMYEAKLLGVRNATIEHDAPWEFPERFSRGPNAVQQVHDAYRHGYVELQVRRRRIDVYA